MSWKLVRRAQTLSPFGVGAILDVEGESLVAADIQRWERFRCGDKLEDEPRLVNLLGVRELRTASAVRERFGGDGAGGGIPYFRFPQWLFCGTCRRMVRHRTDDETQEAPVCQRCQRRPRLTPMRFVMACPNGHLADVPWDYWAHSKSAAGSGSGHPLQFVTSPGGSGLQFLSVRCVQCEGVSRTLAGIATPNSLKALGIQCTGRQPWQPMAARDTTCKAVPQVLQRGATNLTFPSVVSSLHLPNTGATITVDPAVEAVRNHQDFDVLVSAPTNPRASKRIALMIEDLEADGFVLTEERIREILGGAETERRRLEDVQSDPIDERTLLPAEYRALLAPDDQEAEPDAYFVKRDVDLASFASGAAGQNAAVVRNLAAMMGSLVQVVRLREVRALWGFSRLSTATGEAGDEVGQFEQYGTPAKLAPKRVRADLGQLPQSSFWLPAVEVFGEGIFLTFREDAIQAWESSQAVVNRAAGVLGRAAGSGRMREGASPRMIMLHTLAHLLIRQLSFECGYSLASLRERVYAAAPGAEEPMAGLLIYTAAGDSEGTLGGLVREGEARRLLPTILTALQLAEWCSSDPLCRESEGQGLGALNLAACHACALVPETSCTMSNRLLDRGLLLGDGRTPGIGFLEPLLAQLTAALGSDAAGS